ncbi:hypothetical protein Taro_024057, partial [Colocasia esculenta]|nr:hypothetical protein [Colocasia esculenta]
MYGFVVQFSEWCYGLCFYCLKGDGTSRHDSCECDDLARRDSYFKVTGFTWECVLSKLGYNAFQGYLFSRVPNTGCSGFVPVKESRRVPVPLLVPVGIIVESGLHHQQSNTSTCGALGVCLGLLYLFNDYDMELSMYI